MKSPESYADELVWQHYPFADDFVIGAGPDANENEQIKNATELAIITLDRIIEALKIVTGHIELRELDYHEVQLDFEYYQKAKEHLKTKI